MPGLKKETILQKSIFTWRCPSNIAIVKYWGKKKDQIPCNTSVSITLSQSFTETEVILLEKKTRQILELDYFFEGKKQPQFEIRIRNYLTKEYGSFPVLKDHALRIHSFNSFPHSAGIASSASAFGALALALSEASGDESINKSFLKKVSALARLGSGSACRSMFPGFVLWGKNKWIPGSSNQFAFPVKQVHKNFKQMQDAVLILDEGVKNVSSSAGHSLMKDHPFAKSRFKQANERSLKLLEAIAIGDYESFMEIAESEALTLHAMMMTSKEHYILMKPETLAAIEKIRRFRKETAIPVCFTLDAGPNVHVLYAESYKEKVDHFLKNHFNKIIFDSIGKGPEKIN